MTPLAISATPIRAFLAQGSSPTYSLTDEVIAHIKNHHLYLEY